MSVHGVGAAAAHRPQFTQNAQRGNRPSAPQTPTEGEGNTAVGPTSGHNPPAHGVQRLLVEGHFDGKNSYGPLVAKFGAPPEPAAVESSDEIAPLEGVGEPVPTEPVPEDGLVIDASGTALDATLPSVDPEGTPALGLDEMLLDETVPEDPPIAEPGLLDIDALLMEELVNDQTVIEQIVDQLDQTTEDGGTSEDTTDVAA